MFDYTGYEGVVPTIRFPDGSKIVQRPFYIDLTDGQKILLPVGTKILTDDSVIFPDDSTIPSYMISSIPVFDLNDYIQDNTPSVEDALDAIDDNSNELVFERFFELIILSNSQKSYNNDTC